MFFFQAQQRRAEGTGNQISRWPVLYHHPLSSTLSYGSSSRRKVADAVIGEAEPSDKVYAIVEKLRSKNILVSSHQDMGKEKR